MQKAQNPEIPGDGDGSKPIKSPQERCGFQSSTSSKQIKMHREDPDGCNDTTKHLSAPKFPAHGEDFPSQGEGGPPGKLFSLILHGSFCNDLWIFVPGELPEILKSDELKST